VWVSHSPEETLRLGRAMGECAQRGDVFALTGALGAGKTLLTRGIAAGTGGDPGQVTSPTFALVHEYAGRIPLYHLDAYRLSNARELEELGTAEMFCGDHVCVVEWADRAVAALPNDRIDVVLAHTGHFTEREITMRGRGERHLTLLRGVRSMLGR